MNFANFQKSFQIILQTKLLLTISFKIYIIIKINEKKFLKY